MTAPPTSGPSPDGHVAPALLLGGFAAAISVGAIYALVVELQERTNFPTWGLGLLTTTTFAAGFVAQITLAPYSDRGHAKQVVVISLVLAAAGSAWIGFADSLWQLALARTLIGLGFGGYFPTVRGIAVGDGRLGVAERVGRFNAVAVAGFLIGPPYAAIVAQQFGLASPFLLRLL